MTRKIYACLWKGDDLPHYSANKYGARDVANLARNVKRRIPEGELHIFVDKENLSEVQDTGAIIHPFIGIGCGGWSHSFEAFFPDYWPEPDERVLWMGLDTVIMGDPSWLYLWDESPVGLPLDPYATPQPCDAVISFDRQGAEIIWRAYQEVAVNKMRDFLMGTNPSEMYLLRHLYKIHGWAPLEEHPKKLLSYKQHVLCEGLDPLETDIVYFHGNPKLPDLTKGNPVRMEWEAE